MSVPKQQSLFFITLPDLQKLCATRITLQTGIGDPEIWSKVLKTCRQLLFLHQEIFISPVPGILSEIWVVMSISFYKTGTLSAYFEKYEAKMETPQKVVPVILQNCLSFTLTARLAPAWNRAGQLLVQGREFLSQMGKQSAVVLDIHVTETQICLSIEAYMIKLPPPQLEDFDVSQNDIKEFHSDEKAVIEAHSILNNWCYVLPSMKMGQIRSIFHITPPNCPFHLYEDFQKHWKTLYGYKLPEECGTSRVYCSVQFRMMGGRSFTYPLSCIRSKPVQFFPRVDMESVLRSFLSDLKSKLPDICGFPIKMTTKPCYYTKELTTPQMQENKDKPPNLTTERMLGPSLPQVPPTSAPSLTQCSVAKGHKVELSACQPGLEGPPALPPKVPQGQGEGLVPGRAEPPSQGNTHLSFRGHTAPKLVPVFKNQLLQVNTNALEPGSQKRKQLVTESSLSSLKASAVQGDKLNSHPTVKRSSRTTEVSAGDGRPGAAAPLQGGNSCDRGGQLLPAAGPVAEGKQLPDSAVFPGPSHSVAAEESAAHVQVKEKRVFTSKYVTQVLGENHMSLKVKRLPHILRSDTKPDPQTLRQQPLAQIKEADRSEHELMGSQTAAPSRRRSCRGSPSASKRPRSRPTLCAQCRFSKSKVLRLNQSKPKKRVIPKT